MTFCQALEAKIILIPFDLFYLSRYSHNNLVIDKIKHIMQHGHTQSYACVCDTGNYLSASQWLSSCWLAAKLSTIQFNSGRPSNMYLSMLQFVTIYQSVASITSNDVTCSSPQSYRDVGNLRYVDLLLHNWWKPVIWFIHEHEYQECVQNDKAHFCTSNALWTSMT